jgi:ribosomal protein L40E
MAQLADLLVVVLLLLAVARQFPQIKALLGRVLPQSDAAQHSRDTLNERRTIDLVLCGQCGMASPKEARFCTRCGGRLPRFAN